MDLLDIEIQNDWQSWDDDRWSTKFDCLVVFLVTIAIWFGLGSSPTFVWSNLLLYLDFALVDLMILWCSSCQIQKKCLNYQSWNVVILFEILFWFQLFELYCLKCCLMMRFLNCLSFYECVSCSILSLKKEEKKIVMEMSEVSKASVIFHLPPFCRMFIEF